MELTCALLPLAWTACLWLGTQKHPPWWRSLWQNLLALAGMNTHSARVSVFSYAAQEKLPVDAGLDGHCHRQCCSMLVLGSGIHWVITSTNIALFLVQTACNGSSICRKPLKRPKSWFQISVKWESRKYKHGTTLTMPMPVHSRICR